MAAILNNVRLLQETSVVHPHRTTAYHGETVNFTIDFRNYGAQVALTGATAALYWRVPSDEEGYWHQGEASCSGSTAEWTWDATMDNGESPVIWFLKVDADDSNDTTSYRATGELRLLGSPGFTPAVIPPAHATLDFDLINVLHAPYYTKTEADGRYAASSDISLEAAALGAWNLSPLPAEIQDGTPNIVSNLGDYQWRIGTYGAYSEEHYTTEAAAQAATAITISGPDCPTSTEITRAATAYRLGPDAEANPNRDKTLAPADAIPAVVVPSTSSSDAGKAADAKATGDALAEKVSKAGDTMTGTLNAPHFHATISDGFVIALTGGAVTTFEHPGIITVTEQTGANTIAVFVPGTVAAASNPDKTLALHSDIPAVSAETWTFEVDDGQGGTTTVTKSVAVFAAQNAQAAQGGTP